MTLPDRRRRRIPVAQINLVVMPLVVYYLYFGVAFNDGGLIPGSASDWSGFFHAIVPSAAAVFVYLAWFGFHVLLERLLPGRIAQGRPLPDGSTLGYRTNGLLAMAVSLAAVVAGHLLGWLPLTWLHDHFGALLSVITIFSFALALFVWWWGLHRPGGPSKTTGSFVRDYFYGTALNPRVPPVTGFVPLEVVIPCTLSWPQG